ncbi:hypothetical protein TRIADDRAFT_62995, partial [Trichoplax adhaerens]
EIYNTSPPKASEYKNEINFIDEVITDNQGYQISPYDIKLLNDQEKQSEKELLKAITISGFATAQIMAFAFAVWIGRYLDLKAKNKAKEGIRKIMFQQPRIANVIKSDGIISIAAKSVKPNDIILVKAGEKFPVDGIVIDGESEVDNSIIS